MSNDIDLATAIFGNKRLEDGTAESVKIMTGTAVSDSVNGKVDVVIDGTVTGEEYDGELQDNVIELDTNPNVKEGDIVQITAYGGVSNSMIVTGVIGSGDKASEETDEAKKVATNYINFSKDEGLVVGDMTAGSLKGNTQIVSNGVNIRNGTEILANFDSSSASIGASGKGQIIIEPSSITMKDNNINLFQFKTSTITKTGDVFSSINSHDQILISAPIEETSTKSNQIILGFTFEQPEGTTIADVPAFGLTQGGNTADIIAKSSTFRIFATSLSKNNGEIYGETVLFDNASQAYDASVTLSSSCTGYTYLDVFAQDNNEQYIHQRVYEPAVGRRFQIMSMWHDLSGTYIKTKSFEITTTTTIETMSPSSTIYSCGEYNLSSFTQGDVIKIIRVVGLK